MMSRFPAVVSGLGLVTSGGLGAAETWQTVRSGQPTAQALPEFAHLPVRIACPAPVSGTTPLPAGAQGWRLDRFTRLALLATDEAIQDAGLTPSTWNSERVAIVLGCGAWGAETTETQMARIHNTGPSTVSPLALPMSMPNQAAAQLAIRFHATGPNLTVNTACAAGTDALGAARGLLQTGAADIVLAGGTEALLTPYFLATFASMGALSRNNEDPESASRPFDQKRDGFVISEGAGVMVLETEQHAVERSVRPRARITGYGTTCDAHHSTAPHPQGVAAERALRLALTDADRNPSEVDHVNAHGTSTPLNDLTEARVIDRVLPHRPPVTSTKGVTGHALGAAGAIEAGLTVLTIQTGMVPPIAGLTTPDPDIELDLVRDTPRAREVRTALSSSFGFGGHNAVLVLES
ncbi:beta-ketoacyl-[acyl-carrier-protein] synthase family protein [Lipingzhangella sp. LS1_29]|uniref:Beta-ketoacyl-[acyl-carrier-protein] synthase family protein n=1 Tax=Lipingzhangella rawalii TaxID=2055835 RepID=A0ABU2H6Y8_9ACTN|nr:beta-ketoacyl-[acyl-carrier-protein] synthase family protein [Lipingzhangella rawalii]MDS1271056.1 beta-ketoacyl-[acyl-carrier-protein] synthase family protein [Lipingzhangella rawalii]